MADSPARGGVAKRVGRWLLFVVGIGGLSAFGTVWAVGTVLIAPVPRDIGSPPAQLPTARAVSFEVPRHELTSSPPRPVQGWWVPHPSPRATIVLAHGVRGDRRSMVGRACFLNEAGFAVLLYDAQAHGETEGHAITFGYREAQDASAAVAFARSEVGDRPVGFIGVSMGGAAALLGAEPLAIDALVLEQVYPTIEDAVSNRLAMRMGAPGRWLTPLLLAQLPLRLGVQPEDLRPEAGIRTATAPVFLLAGEVDAHTPPSEVRRLAEAAKTPAQVWVVPGAAHVDLHAYARSQYEARVLAFLSRWLEPDD